MFSILYYIYCRITLNTCLKNVVLESKFPSPCLGKYVRKQHSMKPLNQFLTTIRPYSTSNPASSYTNYFLSQLGFRLLYGTGVGGGCRGGVSKIPRICRWRGWSAESLVNKEPDILYQILLLTQPTCWKIQPMTLTDEWAVLWKLRPGKS